MITLKEAIVIELYTGTVMVEGDNRRQVYEYLEKLFGRPVFTHELADKDFQKEIRKKVYPEFIDICANVLELEDNKDGEHPDGSSHKKCNGCEYYFGDVGCMVDEELYSKMFRCDGREL